VRTVLVLHQRRAFVNEEKSARYHRLKRRAAVLGLTWTAGLFITLLLTGASRSLVFAAEWLVDPDRPILAVIVFVTLLMAIHEAGVLPLAFYNGFLLERRYDLSTERFGPWFVDQLKAMALGVVLGTAAALATYACIWRFPEGWWLPAGAAFTFFGVVLANLAPVLILPLFHRMKPIDRDGLRRRLLTLADRAGARVLDAYEWGVGHKTRKANAALTGLGRTRRILVSDTMLSEYSDDEIEVVMAHELAHHVHGDVWKALVFESAAIMAAFYAAARALELAGPWLGLHGPQDIAGLPLILLVVGGVLLGVRPVLYARSRADERSADRFAIKLTNNPAAFVSAMRRLSAQNLAEEQPSKPVRWLFHSHPPTRDRIAEAQAFSSTAAGVPRSGGGPSG
jgi:STE24 endopeptidase